MNSNKEFCVKLIHCGNKNIINPKDQEQKNIFFMPMGLFPLANELKNDGIDVEIIHTDLQPNHSLHRLLHLDTIDAVGFDCHWVNEILVVLETAQAIKQANPHISIFLGGFTASLFAQEIITNYSQIDAVVRGDGEVPIVELVRALQVESPQDELQGVQNLVWRGADKTVHVNEITYVASAENMERLDFAAVELLRNWQFYRSASTFYSHFTSINSTPMFLLEPGRGCQYGCTFCGGNSLAQKKINNRTHTVFRSVDSVLATIKKALVLGFKTFYTCMESEESEPWYIQLLKKVQEQKLDINYGYGCWRIPSRSLVDALSETCSQVVIEISPETADIKVRRQNKDPRIYYTNEELEDCLDYIAGKNNVKVQLFFGYYLASDNQQTILNTIAYIIKLLVKYHGLVEIEYANFSTDPGSLFFFNPQKYSMDIKVRSLSDYVACLKQNYVEKKGQAADMTLFRPRHISPGEDAEIHRKVMLFDYLFTSFRKSVSYILKKTGNPHIIVEFLNNSEIPADSFNRFPAEQVRRLLVDNCMQENILDLYLSRLIVFETRNQQTVKQISRPTVQLYLDHQEVEGLVQEEKISGGELLQAQYKMEDIDGFDF